MKYRTLQDYMPIIKDREAGLTLQEIGDKLGVTRQRAEQIYARGMQLKRTKKVDPFWGLPSRAIDTFTRLGLRDKEEVKRAVEERILHPMAGLQNYRWITHNIVLSWLKMPELPIGKMGQWGRDHHTCPKCGHKF